MPSQLPNVTTPITALELASALDAAWLALFGARPARDTLLILLAQSAHETGHWKSVRCFNLGRVKSTEDDGRDFIYLRCREVLPNGQTIWIDPPHPGTRFRAFETLLEGAIDYLAFLHDMDAEAWEALVEGKPRAFITALKGGAADEGAYARAMGRLYGEFNGQVPMVIPELVIDEELARRANALAALSLFGNVPPPPPPIVLEEDDLEPVVHDTEPAPPPPLDDE